MNEAWAHNLLKSKSNLDRDALAELELLTMQLSEVTIHRRAEFIKTQSGPHTYKTTSGALIQDKRQKSRMGMGTGTKEQTANTKRTKQANCNRQRAGKP